MSKSKSKRKPNSIDKMKLTAFFDGCCEPTNPGGTASYGAVIFKDKERIWECSEVFIPVKGKEKETSNNVAEYSGFIAILEYLLDNELHAQSIKIYGDSKLVIEQMKGEWRIIKGFYKPLAYKAKDLVKKFKKLSLIWIPREENDIADELSKAELKKAGVEFRIQPE
jgi:ribonuclease HI